MTQEEFDKLRERVRYLEELNMVSHPAPESKEPISDLEAKIGVNKPLWNIHKDFYNQEANVDEIEQSNELTWIIADGRQRGLTAGEVSDSIIKSGYRKQSPVVDKEQYPCKDCGKLRNKAEGGTTFTVCDECWDKHYGKAKLSPPSLVGIDEEELLNIITNSKVAELAWKYCDLNDEENGDYNLELAKAVVEYLRKRK